MTYHVTVVFIHGRIWRSSYGLSLVAALDLKDEQIQEHHLNPGCLSIWCSPDK